ncbi:GntR family transcriptional regulator [Rhizobium sp. TRM95796]|uniref:GntR family transcriptional regulator n=1 Tax=Rhizobium sp. TRM95796 TaxID=2979862 RepID=UPI0021E8C485|nr:GntR family transcriptional regulator [Rhizobium sp. TRM95796]MCV3766700.1 GntR family transcriptional regulator [Rhizobium sp. TRM95796]
MRRTPPSSAPSAAAFQTAAPRTAADDIADHLREEILSGRLPGGALIRQDELAARYGVSRMPARDALRRLENEALIEIHPTRGAVVAPFDPDAIREIYALRALLETEALSLACPRLTEADLDAAETALARLEAERDPARIGALNSRFHLSLYAPCGNRRLIDLIDREHAAAERYVRRLLTGLDHQDQSQTEHRAMLDACRQGDTKAAVAILRGHLDDGGRRLLAVVEGGA